MNKPLVVAIVGFGKSATRYHLPYLIHRGNVQVKYVVNIQPEPQREAPYKELGIQFVDSLDPVLADDEVQLLTLCTPPATHFPLAKQVLNVGKNVMVEKPFSETAAQTEELLQLAKEKQLVAMPFQNRRFDSDYLTLKKVLERGYVGEPLELESHFDKYRPDDTIHLGEPRDGSFYGLGIHMLDQVIAVFGRPQAVGYDIRAIQNTESIVDDYYEASLYYGRFKAIVKTSPLVAAPYPRFILHGTMGSYIKYDIDQQENDLKLGMSPITTGFGQDSPNQFGVVKYHNPSGDWITKQIPSEQGDYGRVYDSLFNTILKGAPKLVSDEETLLDIEILEKGVSQPSPSVVRFG